MLHPDSNIRNSDAQIRIVPERPTKLPGIFGVQCSVQAPSPKSGRMTLIGCIVIAPLIAHLSHSDLSNFSETVQVLFKNSFELQLQEHSRFTAQTVHKETQLCSFSSCAIRAYFSVKYRRKLLQKCHTMIGIDFDSARTSMHSDFRFNPFITIIDSSL